MNALTIKQVAAKVALGQSTIYRLIAKGDFPKPFTLVGNRTAWVESDIDAWLAEKAGRSLSGGAMKQSAQSAAA